MKHHWTTPLRRPRYTGAMKRQTMTSYRRALRSGLLFLGVAGLLGGTAAIGLSGPPAVPANDPTPAVEEAPLDCRPPRLRDGGQNTPGKSLAG